MNMRAILTINAVLATSHGVGCVLASTLFMDVYQAVTTPAVAFSGQLFGTELIFIAIVCRKARDLASQPPLQAIALAGVVASTAGAVICTLTITGGVMVATGWLSVLFYAGLALRYLVVMNRKAYSAAGGDFAGSRSCDLPRGGGAGCRAAPVFSHAPITSAILFSEHAVSTMPSA